MVFVLVFVTVFGGAAVNRTPSIRTEKIAIYSSLSACKQAQQAIIKNKTNNSGGWFSTCIPVQNADSVIK